MIDLGISKLAMIGAVALIVIGPEKLPRVARTVGTLIGKAQRYVNDVKAEVNRSMELDELKKMKETVESAAKDVSQSVQSSASDFEKSWAEATSEASAEGHGGDASAVEQISLPEPVPEYHRPNKNWRVKQGALPNWYKARLGVRSKALSGAARVARFRPTKFN
ncbi:MAG: Sec-independent protein translocase protein TatB [Rhodoferax sp.]|nr:Sec-independent protein translocase protein TatB [Rhodoferax sp.]